MRVKCVCVRTYLCVCERVCARLSTDSSIYSTAWHGANATHGVCVWGGGGGGGGGGGEREKGREADQKRHKNSFYFTNLLTSLHSYKMHATVVKRPNTQCFQCKTRRLHIYALPRPQYSHLHHAQHVHICILNTLHMQTTLTYKHTHLHMYTRMHPAHT